MKDIKKWGKPSDPITADMRKDLDYVWKSVQSDQKIKSRPEDSVEISHLVVRLLQDCGPDSAEGLARAGQEEGITAQNLRGMLKKFVFRMRETLKTEEQFNKSLKASERKGNKTGEILEGAAEGTLARTVAGESIYANESLSSSLQGSLHAQLNQASQQPDPFPKQLDFVEQKDNGPDGLEPEPSGLVEIQCSSPKSSQGSDARPAATDSINIAGSHFGPSKDGDSLNLPMHSNEQKQLERQNFQHDSEPLNRASAIQNLQRQMEIDRKKMKQKMKGHIIFASPLPSRSGTPESAATKKFKGRGMKQPVNVAQAAYMTQLERREFARAQAAEKASKIKPTPMLPRGSSRMKTPGGGFFYVTKNEFLHFYRDVWDKKGFES